MTDTLLVTSTEEGIGKTAITIALAKAAQEAGNEVGYMKPKGTRLQSAVGKTRDEDPMLARELLDFDAEMHEMEPIVYSPTFIKEAIRGREDTDELRDRVVENFEALAEDRDTMLVEGSDRLETGGIVDLTDADIAESIDARVLLVSSYTEPGDADEVLAAADQLGDRLAGVLFNGVTESAMDELDDDVIPFLESRGVSVFGALPRVQDLAGITVGDLARSLGADVLTSEASTDVHVERFTVGAMGGNKALDQFRRTRDAVMVSGGDRSEVQTAALEASGIKALLLTGGFRPASAVLGRAEKENVPILLVQSDTRTTIDRVEDVLHSGRTRDAETVTRMQELLGDGVDVHSLLQLSE
ncbi:phosphotransacetylase family protein [Haloarcula salinisoli]|uniref:Phosphotransacetylase family protein n=1 Tax=Haloarcula salinisoli TaxID=2487746 RepID=A0A8J7YI63_9EURY|nr:phosphotransacetylase family protein [Halomicroarcula salinisoli]MBX0285368.1 phosphotransacetylase family protein [Halomicroarcula salinisoli]MBX0303154.1 phosphotransacetylase family protein [Halomicroarcula salinisoli]